MRPRKGGASIFLVEPGKSPRHPGFCCRRNKLLALSPRAPEAADSKVEKNYDDDRCGQKRAVVGALLPACSCAPQNGAEDQDGKQEEDAGNLEPDFAADAAECLEEGAQSARRAAGGLPGHGGQAG